MNNINMEGTQQLNIDVLNPFVDALRRANPGINLMQARTIVYWALCTHYDHFDPKPLLLVYKAFGCGKTDLLSALFPMVKEGRYIQGNTMATIRDEIDSCKTAFFDERDSGEDVVPESLLRKRFKTVNSQVSVNRGEGSGRFTRRTLNINGWTAAARRSLFRDPALMSRCIVISPERVTEADLANARVTDAGSLSGVASLLGEVTQQNMQGRAQQVWRPLASIAGRFNDVAWLGYATANLASSIVEQDLSREYEPEEAIENAFQICRNNPSFRFRERWIRISDVKRTANTEFDKEFKPEEVAAMLQRRGHQVSRIDGYPVVSID